MKRCKVSNKRRHTSQAAAVGAAIDLQVRGRDIGHRPMNVYRCDDCRDWHVGHRPKPGMPPRSARATRPRGM